jgi:hypothetical protein
MSVSRQMELTRVAYPGCQASGALLERRRRATLRWYGHC